MASFLQTATSVDETTLLRTPSTALMIANLFALAHWPSSILAEGTAITLGSLVGTLALAAFIIVKLPADYFSTVRPPILADRHWSLRLTGRIAKNLAGILLVAIGLVMSIPVIPGQGILTLLVGLTFLEFPGKRRLELAIVRQERILRILNALRAKWGRAPLEV